MFCTKCGLKNDDDSMFCAGCGSPLKKPQYSQPVQNVEPVPDVNQDLGAAMFRQEENIVEDVMQESIQSVQEEVQEMVGQDQGSYAFGADNTTEQPSDYINSFAAQSEQAEYDSPQYGGQIQDDAQMYGNQMQDNAQMYGGQMQDNAQMYGDQMQDNAQMYGGQMQDNAQMYGGQMQDNAQMYGGQMQDNAQMYGGQMQDNAQMYGNQMQDNAQMYGNQMQDNAQMYGNQMQDNTQMYGGNQQQFGSQQYSDVQSFGTPAAMPKNKFSVKRLIFSLIVILASFAACAGIAMNYVGIKVSVDYGGNKTTMKEYNKGYNIIKEKPDVSEFSDDIIKEKPDVSEFSDDEQNDIGKTIKLFRVMVIVFEVVLVLFTIIDLILLVAVRRRGAYVLTMLFSLIKLGVGGFALYLWCFKLIDQLKKNFEQVADYYDGITLSGLLGIGSLLAVGLQVLILICSIVLMTCKNRPKRV